MKPSFSIPLSRPRSLSTNDQEKEEKLNREYRGVSSLPSSSFSSSSSSPSPSDPVVLEYTKDSNGNNCDNNIGSNLHCSKEREREKEAMNRNRNKNDNGKLSKSSKCEPLLIRDIFIEFPFLLLNVCNSIKHQHRR